MSVVRVSRLLEHTNIEDLLVKPSSNIRTSYVLKDFSLRPLIKAFMWVSSDINAECDVASSEQDLITQTLESKPGHFSV